MRCINTILVLCAGLATGACLCQPPARPEASSVLSCKQAAGSEPKTGEAFKSKVHNDDYHFNAEIPSGLTGWSGTGESAPFHGFTIFLDDTLESCIVFEVHVRVDEDDGAKRPGDAKTVWLGQARSWETARRGFIDRSKITNVKTVFVFQQPGQVDDGSILLVAPFAGYREALRIYRLFQQRLKFER